nr:GAF domain-containing sensor histidine kinase [Calothrix sp. MO_167.B42]
SLDESQILQTATEELARVLQIESCHIELYDKYHTTAIVVYECSNIVSKSQGISIRIADFPEVYQQLLQKKSLQFVENISDENIPDFNHKTIQSACLACPIFESHGVEGILGNLWLLRPREEIFKDFEVQLVQQIASQCAIAIRQARLYKASQTQVEELEKLNRLKDDFLKSVSHELRTPMSSIQLSIQTLDKLFETETNIKKSPKLAKVIDIFHHASQRYNKLIDDLLTVCYIDAQAESLTSECVDLRILIPEIVEPFFQVAQNQEQKIKIELENRLPLLNSDISMLKRIFTELLNNACKYTPHGETITFIAKSHFSTTEISVLNRGVEIPPEEIKHIFDKFYRIPKDDPWRYGGTGLGLTLVKKMVELLGAEIYVESYESQTKFSVRFPETVEGRNS